MPKRETGTDSVKGVDDAIRAAGDALQDLLKLAIDRLKDEGTKTRLFPNGVELIHFKLEAKSILTLEVKIAGEKGIKGADTSAVGPSADDGTPETH